MSQLQIGEPDSRTHHTQPSTGSGAKIAGITTSTTSPTPRFRGQQHAVTPTTSSTPSASSPKLPNSSQHSLQQPKRSPSSWPLRGVDLGDHWTRQAPWRSARKGVWCRSTYPSNRVSQTESVATINYHFLSPLTDSTDNRFSCFIFIHAFASHLIPACINVLTASNAANRLGDTWYESVTSTTSLSTSHDVHRRPTPRGRLQLEATTTGGKRFDRTPQQHRPTAKPAITRSSNAVNTSTTSRGRRQRPAFVPLDLQQLVNCFQNVHLDEPPPPAIQTSLHAAVLRQSSPKSNQR